VCFGVDRGVFVCSALLKYPKKGDCKKPVLMNHHRIGMIPVMSVLDGALSGVIAREICLECGKQFKKGVFQYRKQPNKLRVSQ
jgi:hypothetical protein